MTKAEESVTCTAKLTTGDTCKRPCYKRKDWAMYSGREFWSCPTHGLELFIGKPIADNTPFNGRAEKGE